MHFNTIAPAAAFLLFSSLVNASPLEERTTDDGCNADNALRALRRFSEEAIPFCSAYISVPVITEVAATTTPVVTVTNFATVTSPLVDKRAAPTHVARDEIAPEDLVFGVEIDEEVLERRDVAIPSFVTEYPASRISSACSCMTIPTSTTTVTSTAPTATATNTVTVVEDPRGDCKTPYNACGNGYGNHVEIAIASSHYECCKKCHSKKNCVASAYAKTIFGKICQHLVSNQSSKPTTDICPLGLVNYNFGAPGSGIVYPGPCGY